MKATIKKRLHAIESNLKLNQRIKCALVVCDPEILHTFDFSFIEADHIVILPDNDLRCLKINLLQKDLIWFVMFKEFNRRIFDAYLQLLIKCMRSCAHRVILVSQTCGS